MSDRIAKARAAICRTRGVAERAPKTPGARVAAQRKVRAARLRLTAALREADEARRG